MKTALIFLVMAWAAPILGLLAVMLFMFAAYVFLFPLSLIPGGVGKYFCKLMDKLFGESEGNLF